VFTLLGTDVTMTKEQADRLIGELGEPEPGVIK
jgi:hypothetical protein